ncbi:MAG TPA: divalent metal cation transporter [Thermoanaerobaculia bacterium]|nr:divalent metal cation transporter [Thermoanaerobaculia bacterium]
MEQRRQIDPEVKTPEQPPRLLRTLGPGLIAGAADDDPSGIATYSIAGASLGTSLLWTAALTWPLMATVQMTCARIAMVTGEGLGSALRRKLPRAVMLLVTFSLFAANTINIAADLAGMADAASLFVRVRPFVFVVVFAVAITWATIRLRYESISRILKWLAVALFAYVATAIHVTSDWPSVLRDAVLPSWPRGSAAWSTLVAILGTTISPYLFFWQASLEVEEEKAEGKRRLQDRRGATPQELAHRRLDVGIGTFFSNFVMFFVILTTAFTLHGHGHAHPKTSREIARALEPLAGRFSELLYAVGLIGVGLLAIPSLSGSAAYAFAETFGWKQGLDQRLRGAKPFYLVVIASTVLAAMADLAKFGALPAMYWSAVINGLLAPVLLVAIYLVATDGRLMRGAPIPHLSRWVLAAACLFMLLAGVGMFVF